MLNPPEINFIFELVTNLGAIGFIFWMAWRTNNVTIPRIVKNSEDAIKLQRDDFLSATKEQREFFKIQVEREREISQMQSTKIVETITDLKEEIRNKVE
jgi:hypothetical protein